MGSAGRAGPDLRLDDCDCRLISQVQLDGRLGLNELAQTLGVHRNTAKARLDRLLRHGVLIPTVHVDPVCLGYLAPATIAVKVTPSRVNAVARRVATIPAIQFVHVCTGTYDLFLSGGRFRTEQDLYSFVTDQLSRITGILAVETVKSVGLERFALRPAAPPRQRRPPGKDEARAGTALPAARPLDDQDQAIIRELQRGIRQPASALAGVLGMNRKSVAGRLERLLGEGIVKPVMIADPRALGYPLGVIIGVTVMPGQLAVVAEGLKSLASLQYLVLCMGRFNMVAWCRCRDLDDLCHMMTAEVAGIAGVREVATSLILREDKTPYPFRRLRRAPKNGGVESGSA